MAAVIVLCMCFYRESCGYGSSDGCGGLSFLVSFFFEKCSFITKNVKNKSVTKSTC